MADKAAGAMGTAGALSGTTLLSVVIPTYNRATTTAAAIESVDASTPSAVEIVVVDDASDPPFAEQISCSINSAGIPIRILRLAKNLGPGGARNLGVRSARGRYIAFLDSDDTFTREKVDILLKYIPYQGSDRVFAHRAVGGSFGNNLMISLLERWGHIEWIRRLLIGYANPFYTPCLCVPKAFALTLPAIRYCEDYLVSLNVVRRNLKVVVLAGRLSILGREPNSKGGLSRGMYSMLSGETQVRRFVVASKKYPLSTRAVSALMIPLSYLRTHITRALKAILRVIQRSTDR